MSEAEIQGEESHGVDVAALKDWFKQRPYWLQKAAMTLLENQEKLPIDEAVELCKRFREASEVPESEGPRVDVDWESLLGGAAVEDSRLLRIKNVTGLNALKPRRPLELGDCDIAIVYGANGSGKSGYVRAIKSATGARVKEAIYSNVFEEEESEPRCTFEAEIAGKSDEYPWDAETGIVPELRGIAVFDKKCGDVYVNGYNEVTYEPAVLRFFAALADICSEVKSTIEEEIAQLNSQAKVEMPFNL